MNARLVLIMTLMTACHQDEAGVTPAAHPAEVPVEGRDASPATAPAARAARAFVRPGPLVIRLRPFELGVYLPGPVTPALHEGIDAKVTSLFPGVKLLHEPRRELPPTVVVEAPEFERFALPPPEQLERLGRELSAKQIATAESSTGVVVLDWLLDADPTRSELRKAQQLVLELAQKNSGFVWDETTRELYSVDSWKKLRVDGWQGDIPDVRKFFTTHYYETEGRHRAVTLGMAKLGLPDLVVDDVPPAESSSLVKVLDAVAQLLVEDAAVGEQGRLVVDLHAMAHRVARSAYLAAAGPNATLQGAVTLEAVDREEGDAENRLVAVRFDGYPGTTEVEREGAAVRAILGASRDRTTPK